MKLIVSATSDIGNTRQENEDMILIGHEFLRDTNKDYEFDFDPKEHPFLIAIADGMGGHQNGAYASELLLNEANKVIAELPSSLTPEDLKKHLNDSLKAIHQKLIFEAEQDPQKHGMGSTFVGTLFYDKAIYLINVGDSRLYRFRNNLLIQISKDHSLSAVSQNENTPKNIILNSFGAGEHIFIDIEDISNRILPKDTLLLCSDGLSDELNDFEIEDSLSESLCSKKLTQQVKTKKAEDNISIVTVQYNLK